MRQLVLGVDFGTSNTAAVLRRPGGLTRPLLFDGSPLLPSAVCLDGDGLLHVGRDAMHVGRTYPQGLEVNPKRCIDDGHLLLGGTEVSVVDVIAAVLRRVAEQAHSVAGRPPDQVWLTCPAGWGVRRRQLLVEAGRVAGLGTAVPVAEPLAAASYFLADQGQRIGTGSTIVVYDFGAGTFDASVVRRSTDGFEVLAERGLADVGGADLDAAIVGSLGGIYARRNAQLWNRLSMPSTTADRRAALQLWDDVRHGKEILSRAATTTIPVPLFDDTAPLGRELLERLATPILMRTVDATRAAIRDAGLEPSAVSEVFLVGGSSRIPLAATLLHRTLGIAPTVIDQPELVVALGSLHVHPEVRPAVEPAVPPVDGTAPAASTAAATAPVPQRTVVRLVAPAPTKRGRSRRPTRRMRSRRFAVAPVRLAVTAVAVLIACMSGAMLTSSTPGVQDGADQPDPRPPTRSATPPAPSASAAASTAPSLWKVFNGHTKPVHDVAFSPDGRTLASAGWDDTVRMWSVDTGQNITTLPFVGPVSTIAYSPDGQHLAGAGIAEDAPVVAWSVATGQITSTMRGHGSRAAVEELAYSPDGTVLASAADDFTVRLWNPVTGRTVARLTAPSIYMDGLAFSPDGALIVTACWGDKSQIQLWNAATGRSAGTLPGASGSDVAFNRDGTLAVTAPYYNIQLWDINTRVHTATIAGNGEAIWDLAFSPDGRLLAGAVKDGTIRLWDVASRRSIATLAGHVGSVWSVDFSPDSRILASAGDDHTTRLWNLAGLTPPR